MAWLPPVNLPDLSQRDYSGQLYGMTAGIGDAIRQNRRDAVGDEQWEKNYARQLDLDAWNKSVSDRNYDLALRKQVFDEADAAAGGGDEFALQPFYLEGPGGELIPAQTKKSGGYETMDIPDGYKVAPGVHYEDFGTYIGVFDRAGNLIGTRPKQGDIQPGMVQTGGMDPNGVPGGVAPMAGTKESIERTQAQTQARNRLNAAGTQAGVVMGEIDKVIDLTKGGWATGTTGAAMDVVGAVAPTSRGELMNSLATIRGNISFDKLQAMREMSPTGGALGQVSDFENRLLQATAGPIDPMNADQMVATLENIKDRYEDAVVAHHIAYLTDFEGLPREVADQAIDAIRQGKDPQAVLQRIQELAGGG